MFKRPSSSPAVWMVWGEGSGLGKDVNWSLLVTGGEAEGLVSLLREELKKRLEKS